MTVSSRHPDQGGSAAAEIPARYPDIPTSLNPGTLSPQHSGACGRAVGASLPALQGRFHETPLRGSVREDRGESLRIEVIDYV